MKYPIFHKVIIEDNITKAVMLWKDNDKEGTWSFTLGELKLRAGIANLLLENEREYKKAIGAVMAVERPLKTNSKKE